MWLDETFFDIFNSRRLLYKVITTLVIRSLDDPTWCAQYLVADSQPLGLEVHEVWGWAHSTARPWVPISSLFTNITVWLQFQRGTFQPPRFGGLGGREGRGWAHSLAPWVSVSSPLIHGLYLTVFELFGFSARPSDPDTMTNTAVEAFTSLSGQNWQFAKIILAKCEIFS